MSSKTLMIILVATVAMLLTWGFYAFFAREVTHFIEGKHHWFHNYEPWSLMGFITTFIIATSMFLPAQPFVVAVGYLFGFHFLTILFTVAVYALASFLMFNGARYWFRPMADEWLKEHRVVLGMAQYVKDPVEGAKLNFLFSFTPIAFCIHCYVMGITEIDEHIFIVTFLMGQAPHIFFGILTGSAMLAAESADLTMDSFKIGMLALGVVCTFAAMIYLMHMAEEVLRQMDDGTADKLIHGASAKPVMCGVGITFDEGDDGALYVSLLRPGSPAALSGKIQLGDVLHEVDGRNVFRAKVDLISKLIPGDDGTTVLLGMRRRGRQGDSDTYIVELIRRPILHSGAAPRLTVPAGGYRSYGAIEAPATPEERRRVAWMDPEARQHIYDAGSQPVSPGYVERGCSTDLTDPAAAAAAAAPVEVMVAAYSK